MDGIAQYDAKYSARPNPAHSSVLCIVSNAKEVTAPVVTTFGVTYERKKKRATRWPPVVSFAVVPMP